MRSGQDPRPTPRPDKKDIGDLPDWLEALRPKEKPAAMADEAPAHPPAEASPAKSLVDADDFPDWLRALAEAPESAGDAEPSATDDPEELPPWALADETPASHEEPASFAGASSVWTVRGSGPKTENEPQPTAAIPPKPIAGASIAETTAPRGEPTTRGSGRSIVLALGALIVIIAIIALVLGVL